MIRQLDASQPDFNNQLETLLSRESHQVDDVSAQVKVIIDAVRKDGDSAVLKYTQQFDRLAVNRIEECEIPLSRAQQACETIDAGARQALQKAAARIREYHQHQVQQDWSYQQADGSVLGQKITPLDRVGIYVPGGKAAYPSSVLMSAVTAKVAGVSEIIMVVPTPDNSVNDYVLAAAFIGGVDRIFTIGGAQAVAALAYGTETIPSVDKIVGPGNIYVATAKKMVFGKVGIDMIAGPSEVLVVCDDSVNPDWVAMDLFAQAEHDELAQSIMLTDSPEMMDKVQQSIERLLVDLPRREIVTQSLKNAGALILAPAEMHADIINTVAPEHLQLMTQDANALSEKVKHAGAIFIGQYSAESLGDYCAGPNHVLPTSGTARFSSPLGVYDFQKRSSIINFTEAGAKEIAPLAEKLANIEGLQAHGLSAKYRVD